MIMLNQRTCLAMSCGKEIEHAFFLPFLCALAFRRFRLVFYEEIQKGGAALQNIGVCFVKISGVPGICDVAGRIGKGKKLVDFSLWVAVCDSCHVADVGRIHADEIVVAGIVRFCHADGTVRD